MNAADLSSAPTEPKAEAPPRLEIHGSRQWVSWQAEQGISLGFSTYQAGKFFLVGLKPDGDLAVFERTFARCMGLAQAGDSVYLTSKFQIWRLNNVLEPGQRTAAGHDKVYVPNVAWVTGDVDAHDLGLNAQGVPIFVNTLFSCLATVSESSSFVPVWKPRFVTALKPEDRCHLNGLAMQDGQARYVTAVARTDIFEGWREHRRDGGVVIDVPSHEVVCGGLSMPHSPRLHRGELYVLNSGTGEFGRIDRQAGRFEPIAFCPGYARGLALWGDYALIGLSKPRENKTFSGLALDQALADKQVSARCGVVVVDLRSGAMVHALSIDGVVSELYDVCVLPGVQRPSAIGLVNDEIHRTLRVGEHGEL